MHTKGPWVADQSGVWDEQGNDIAVCGELAQWSGDCFHPFQNAEANVRLIAAAPDLLTELAASTAEMMGTVRRLEDAGLGNLVGGVARQCDMNRAAIARATGAGA